MINDGKRSNYNNGVAAILSFLVPGVGQIYQERFLVGLAFFVFTALGYLLIVLGFITYFFAFVDTGRLDPDLLVGCLVFSVPGVMLHFFAVINAARYKPEPPSHC